MRAVDRRLALGQWFTPPMVADLALSLVLPREAGARRGVRLLDPACGDGVFLRRAIAAGVAPAGVVGVEIDPAAAAAARAAVPGASVVLADLFAAGLGGRVPDATGFDIVVGNPPYVRADRLAPAQRASIRERLRADFAGQGADLEAVLGRGDLAAACVLRSLSLLRPSGRAALVVSSALVDAGYADALWRCVRRLGHVAALVEAPAERWFADAAVHTMIVVLERHAASSGRSDGAAASGAADPAASSGIADGLDRPARLTRVARLTVSTAAAAARGLGLDQLGAVADLRDIAGDAPGRWAAALRADPVWFEVERACGEALVPLGALARLQRGVTSGANDVFYLSRARARSLGLEPALLLPLVRSPRDGGAAPIAIDPASTPTLALACPADPDALARYPRAAAYVHAHAAAAIRPTLAARRAWWALPLHPARLFLTKAYAARFAQRLAPVPVVADQRVYTVDPRPGVDLEALAAALNATVAAFALESLGRASLGEGALEWTVSDARTLPVLDVRRATPAQQRALVAAFAALAPRPVADLAGERGRADRAALDRAAVALAPGLAPLLPAVWDALLAAVSRRNRGRALLEAPDPDQHDPEPDRGHAEQP